MNARYLAFLGVMLCVMGCESQGDGYDPPLQPIAYTESPGYTPALAAETEAKLLSAFTKTGNVPSLPGTVSATGRVDSDILDNIIESDIVPDSKGGTKPAGQKEFRGYDNPVNLVRAVYDVLLSEDLERYNRLFIGPQALNRLVGVDLKTGRSRTAALKRSGLALFKLFKPGNPSEELEGGLGERLSLVGVELGKPGTLAGKTPKRGEETVQYWGTTVQFQLQTLEDEEGRLTKGGPQAPPMVFTLTLGRILLTPGGGWKLASAPKVSKGFETFIDAGLHLKPELLEPEHHAFPLSVGNFWSYRVSRPGFTAPESTLGLATPSNHSIRLEVTGVDKFKGYRVVTLRRTETVQEAETTVRHLLVTPRRVYPCSRYCRSRSKDLKYVLDYIRQSAPVLLFPLKPGMGWTYGGELSDDKTRYQTGRSEETVVVPVGEFTDALSVVSQTRTGADTRYFKRGVGVLKRSLRGSTGTRLEELVEYRILNVE